MPEYLDYFDIYLLCNFRKGLLQYDNKSAQSEHLHKFSQAERKIIQASRNPQNLHHQNQPLHGYKFQASRLKNAPQASEYNLQFLYILPCAQDIIFPESKEILRAELKISACCFFCACPEFRPCKLKVHCEAKDYNYLDLIAFRQMDLLLFRDLYDFLFPVRKVSSLKAPFKEYKLSKKEYIANHPELKAASNEVKNKHYEHYEQKRQDKIEEAKKRRDEIIKEEEEKNPEADENTETKGSSKKKKKQENESTLIQKEKEKLEVMKKQQIGEIKNMIDFEYKMAELRKESEEKMKKQKEKELKLQKERLKLQKEKEEKLKKWENEKIEKQKKEEEELKKKLKENEEKQKKLEKEEKERKKKKDKELKQKKEEQEAHKQELRKKMEENQKTELEEKKKKQEE